jgi:hypothetical protein
MVLGRIEQTAYPAELLARLVHSCPVLASIDLCGQTVSGGSETFWAQMLAARPALEGLSSTQVHGMEFTDRVMLSIAENCVNMRYLEFRAAPTLTDAGITAVARRCPKLRSLDAAGDACLTDASLYALAEHSKYLERSILQGSFTADAVQFLLRSCTKMMMISLPKACMSTQAAIDMQELLLPRRVYISRTL